MTQGTQIFYRGYAENSAGRNWTSDASFYTEPTQVGGPVSFSAITSNSMTVSWSAGGGDGAIVVMREGPDPVNVDPQDGTEHDPGTSDFTDGANLGGSPANYVVFRAAGTFVNVTGLSPTTTYYVAVYEYAGSGSGLSGINYQQDAPQTGSARPPTLRRPPNRRSRRETRASIVLEVSKPSLTSPGTPETEKNRSS
jgi:hypothetical protein